MKPTDAQLTVLSTLALAFDGGFAENDFGRIMCDQGLRGYAAALAACKKRGWVIQSMPVGSDKRPGFWWRCGSKEGDRHQQPSSRCWLRITREGYLAMADHAYAKVSVVGADAGEGGVRAE